MSSTMSFVKILICTPVALSATLSSCQSCAAKHIYKLSTQALTRTKLNLSHPIPANLSAHTKMTTYASLIELRQRPAWEHKFVKRSDEIPVRTHPFQLIDNDIHPIWRYLAFRDYQFADKVRSTQYDSPVHNMTPEFYERISPALRLASLFLIQAIPFLVRVVRSPLVKISTETNAFDRHWRPVDDDFDYLNQELTLFANEYRILYLEPFDGRLPTVLRVLPSMSDGVVIGLTASLFNEDALQDMSLEYRPILSCISAESFNEFYSSSWLAKTPIARASIWWEVATTLTHEFAHALYLRRLRQEPTLIFREPRVPPEVYSELGTSITAFLFGFVQTLEYKSILTRFDLEAGRKRPRFRPVFDGSYGLIAAFLGNLLDWDKAPTNIIAAQTIFSMFDQNTWTAPKKTFYLLPRSPPHITPSTASTFLDPIDHP